MLPVAKGLLVRILYTVEKHKVIYIFFKLTLQYYDHILTFYIRFLVMTTFIHLYMTHEQFISTQETFLQVFSFLKRLIKS